MSVLLVEDNDDFRFYLKDNLRNKYKVIEAVNGKDGWQKALFHHPHLIVTDISMPEMDGIELIKGLETGANDYITKPFNFEVLHAKIKKPASTSEHYATYLFEADQTDSACN